MQKLRFCKMRIRMVKFTDEAREQLVSALEEGEMVRVAVRGGGCSGMTYALHVETEIDEEDIRLDPDGPLVYIDPHSASILQNTTIDYISGFQQKGFVFNNPDANTTCGCGSSFS